MLIVSTRHRFATGFGFGLTCGFGFGVGVGLTGGVTGGVSGAGTSVSAQSLLFAEFVSPPSPVTVAQLSYVPV